MPTSRSCNDVSVRALPVSDGALLAASHGDVAVLPSHEACCTAFAKGAILNVRVQARDNVPKSTESFAFPRTCRITV